MCGAQRLCGSEHVARHLYDGPECAIGGETFHDCADTTIVEGPFGYAAPQRAAYLDGQYGGNDAIVLAQELQHVAATGLVDIALDERARVEIRVRHE